MTGSCSDRVVRDLWHILGAIEELPRGQVKLTRLLGEPLALASDDTGSIHVWRPEGTTRQGEIFEPGSINKPLPVKLAYGYVWTSLGTPKPDLFAIPEYDEPDRRNVHCATFKVHVSAPRAVENFLDMGHFPFVHANYLGIEAKPEVKDYDVEISTERDEVLATRCRFFQPIAALSATGGMEVEYIYRVPHPYCAILYKSCPADEKRLDVVTLFLQPIDEEHVAANMLMSIVDHDSSDTAIKAFQQKIFGQDKPILENQIPKRLPLDPRAEMPVRADKSSIAYRRWLSQKGITYGCIPAAAA